MRIDQLLRYDIPEAVVELWRRTESGDLLPLQERAVKRHNLFGGDNLLIQAPTSSGKTFVGEMAAVHTALRRKQVVYLVPLKALAEEKYRAFRDKYTEYGLKVIISTRDHRDYDGDLERGDFSLAVVVYEKLSQLLVRRPERAAEIDLVIADELEILSDPERGAGAELLLTRLLRGACRVIGLSAVIGGAERLAEWMRADLLQSDQRPVELRYGVLHEGAFRYRTYNEPGEGAEALVDACSESVEEIVGQNVAAFAAVAESCIVFVRAKHDSRRGADRLAAVVDLPPASEALALLEPTKSREALRAVLAHGVAFHNADLSPAERHIVESAFRSGEVRVMVSTSTLAVGLSLPGFSGCPGILGAAWRIPGWTYPRVASTAVGSGVAWSSIRGRCPVPASGAGTSHSIAFNVVVPCPRHTNSPPVNLRRMLPTRSFGTGEAHVPPHPRNQLGLVSGVWLSRMAAVVSLW